MRALERVIPNTHSKTTSCLHPLLQSNRPPALIPDSTAPYKRKKSSRNEHSTGVHPRSGMLPHPTAQLLFHDPLDGNASLPSGDAAARVKSLGPALPAQSPLKESSKALGEVSRAPQKLARERVCLLTVDSIVLRGFPVKLRLRCCTGDDGTGSRPSGRPGQRLCFP